MVAMIYAGRSTRDLNTSKSSLAARASSNNLLNKSSAPLKSTCKLPTCRAQIRRRDPLVDGLFRPDRDRYGADPVMLAQQIDNDPPVFAFLKLGQAQLRRLAPPQTCTQQDGEKGPIPLAFDGIHGRACTRRSAFSTFSQFPNRTPLRRGPLIFRILAALSVLISALSASSDTSFRRAHSARFTVAGDIRRRFNSPIYSRTVALVILVVPVQLHQAMNSITAYR